MQTPDDEALSALIRRDATRHDPPAGLAEQIKAGVRAAGAQPAPAASGQPFAWPTRRRWLESMALFGAGMAATWVALIGLPVPGLAAPTAEDILASHLRSLMTAHLSDVVSSDRHTVKPWFAGKLDFSPPVHDLADAGYALSGGRMELVAGRSAAVLVYRLRLHVINLFIWPAAQGSTTPAAAHVRRGYCLVEWTQGGMHFWAASDASTQEMLRFADACRSRLDSSAAR